MWKPKAVCSGCWAEYSETYSKTLSNKETWVDHIWLVSTIIKPVSISETRKKNTANSIPVLNLLNGKMLVLIVPPFFSDADVKDTAGRRYHLRKLVTIIATENIDILSLKCSRMVLWCKKCWFNVVVGVAIKLQGYVTNIVLSGLGRFLTDESWPIG